MKRILAGAVLTACLAGPAAADEIETTLEAALEAYRAGDIALAREELTFAETLLDEKKADRLGEYLPMAPPGWTRDQDAGTRTASAGLAAMGGMRASARYRRGNDRVEVALIAEGNMVRSLAMMFSNPAMMGSMGEVRRVGRNRVVVTDNGDVQALVDKRILVQVNGAGSAEDKIAFFEEIDIEGLREF